jgi:sarcosine oxidase delta subunit
LDEVLFQAMGHGTCPRPAMKTGSTKEHEHGKYNYFKQNPKQLANLI